MNVFKPANIVCLKVVRKIRIVILNYLVLFTEYIFTWKLKERNKFDKLGMFMVIVYLRIFNLEIH